MTWSLSKEEFLNKGVIFADTIEEAFALYESVMIEGSKLQMEKFLWKALEINDGKAYADFYYPVLEKEQQSAFLAGLSEEEKECFSSLETDKRQVYYPLNEQNLKFFSEITAREWLFSTFYFDGEKAMLWGNYGMQYPLFAREKAALSLYIKIAEECGLEIRECQQRQEK